MKKKISKNAIFKTIILTSMLILSFATVAFGATNTWAKNLSSWVLDGVKAILVCVIAAFSIKFVVKRQFVQFIGFLILAAFVSVIAFGPDKLQALGNTLWGIIFK